MHQDLRHLVRSHKSSKTIENYLQPFGLLRQLLLHLQELVDQLVVFRLLLHYGLLKVGNSLSLLVVEMNRLHDFLPPNLVLGVLEGPSLDIFFREEIQFFTGDMDQELLALRNEGLDHLLEVVVQSFDSVLSEHT